MFYFQEHVSKRFHRGFHRVNLHRPTMASSIAACSTVRGNPTTRAVVYRCSPRHPPHSVPVLAASSPA